MSEVLGSRIWREFKPEDVKRLRLIGRRKLIAMGMHPSQVTDREVDKWLESRLSDTLESYLRMKKNNM